MKQHILVNLKANKHLLQFCRGIQKLKSFLLVGHIGRMLFGNKVERVTSGLSVAEIAEDHQEDVHKH